MILVFVIILFIILDKPKAVGCGAGMHNSAVDVDVEFSERRVTCLW